MTNPVYSHLTIKNLKKVICRKAGAWLFNNRGSASVEATLAIPIFLFFVANLLSLFIMYEGYSVRLSKLHDEVYEASVAAHMAEGGNDLIILTDTLPIHPIIGNIAFEDSSAKVAACSKKWTGYDLTSGIDLSDDEEYVYITESGSVYHRSKDCSHLRVNISVCSSDDIASKRNANGEKYRPCEKCGGGKSTGLLFITDQGNRYHNSPACSGLKRTIKTVPLSEVEGRPPCSVCGR